MYIRMDFIFIFSNYRIFDISYRTCFLALHHSPEYPVLFVLTLNESLDVPNIPRNRINSFVFGIEIDSDIDIRYLTPIPDRGFHVQLDRGSMYRI